MSYGVALRNGIPFTLGTIAALCVNATSQAWSPAALWPTGTEAGMWIDPSNLTSQWQDSTGTTPVATPGTVADSSNPVGLALDIRAGAPEVLGPELVANGDFSAGTTGWSESMPGSGTLSVVSGALRYTANGTIAGTGILQTVTGLSVGTTYKYAFSLVALTDASMYIYAPSGSGFPGAGGFQTLGEYSFTFVATNTSFSLVLRFAGPAETDGDYFELDNISVREIPGNHLLQATSTARPLLSAYDGQTLGPGDTYPSTGFPIYQKYDGTDDGMATASFAAGTLTSAMDCMIAVRRDAATKGVLFSMSYGSAAYCGHYEAGSSAVGRDAVGTPTVWVDGTQLTGGTSVTASTLDTALTVGNWHIVEFQGLDLGAFTAFQFGNWFSGFQFNGGQGGILLFPSSTSAADRDAARTWLGAKVGLTL